jgi:hypothetical protein
MAALVIVLTILPWVGYEALLKSIGSTSVTDHAVFHKILDYPRRKGLADYLVFVSSQVFLVELGYISLFVSPVASVAYAGYLKRPVFKGYTILVTTAFIGMEAAILSGLFDPPTPFYRNVLFNFGVGPIQLKDTYILGVQRLPEISPAIYYALVYCAVLTAGVLLGLLASSAKRIFLGLRRPREETIGFLPSFVLWTGLAYLGIITLTGFHDRYLIPAFILVIIWVVSDRSLLKPLRWWKTSPAVPLFIAFAVMSPLLVHDFMEMKRALKKAQDHVVQTLKTSPCRFDGGFEFNGYHCCRYEKRVEAKGALSWWWVDAEEYLLTLGPLPVYRTVKTFSFRRYAAPNGAVHILRPLDLDRERKPTVNQRAFEASSD